VSTEAPCQHPSTILALSDEPSRVARLRAAWGNALQACDTQIDLVVASRTTGVALVVVPTRDRHGQSLATTVAAIRASRQNAAVYVYAERSADSMRELLALAIAGARGVIVRDVDDDPASLRQLLDRGSLTRAIETITLAVQQVVPLRQRPLVLLCSRARQHSPGGERVCPPARRQSAHPVRLGGQDWFQGRPPAHVEMQGPGGARVVAQLGAFH
jgi:hypothetical protein